MAPWALLDGLATPPHGMPDPVFMGLAVFAALTAAATWESHGIRLIDRALINVQASTP